MEPALPRVVVSVVHWHGAAHVLRCVRALHALDYPDVRVVVVDNASRDDAVARLRERHPRLTIRRTDANLGFAGGQEVGVAEARRLHADAVWLVNSDARVEPGSLRELVDAWRRHGEAVYGALTLRRASDGSAWLDSPAKLLDPRYRPSAWRRDRPVPATATWIERGVVPIGAAVGTAMFVPMSLLARYGGMSREWFMYCEEIDWALRLRRAGVPCRLVPAARVWHPGGGSAAGDVMQYYRARNEIVLAHRHGPVGSAACIALKKSARAAAMALGRPRGAAWVAAGVVDAVRGRLGKTHAPEDTIRPTAAGGQSLRARLRPLVARVASLRRPRLRVDGAGGARIVWNERHPVHLREYYRRCVGLFAERLRELDAPIDLVFGDHAVRLDGDRRTFRIGFQCEHTLVRPGGRDSEGAVAGGVPIGAGPERWLVRVAGMERLRRMDVVIDYSRPNLVNVASSGRHADYLAKTIQISPSLYGPELGAGGRDGDAITLFADADQPRRRRFLDEAMAFGLALRNVRGCWDADALQRLYARTRVLVNVHQTDDHATLEELRVLPALLCGVVVVSEDVPLKLHVPYADMIVWSSYDDLVETTQAVLADYESYHRRIFGGPEPAGVFRAMAQHDRDEVARAVCRLTGGDATVPGRASACTSAGPRPAGIPSPRTSSSAYPSRRR